MIDAHCHIDLYSDPMAQARKVENERIRTIAVTNLPSHFELGYPHLKNFKNVRLALGVHPLHANQHTDGELKRFVRLAKSTSYIGEIGLDFSPEGNATREKQVDSLRFVLTHINDRPRYISLHSRRAERSVLQLLKEFSIEQAVFHWYSGSLSVLKEIVTAGYFFSINPAMIRSSNGRKIIEHIPSDRLLTETDGPFVKVDGRIIESQDVAEVLNHLSSLWDCTYEDAERQIENNFNTILRPVKRVV
ncbi:Qat anti-phage system TatD family nuclease QatD [Alicyclobacillus dauci]|uniref:TatD family hydrolase n=1 Tax=Alicyclobacillus dauci TaxID=1475485 RepID=A0ABY6Z442_9BACL|nr:Qat anti-phage system TatD family nuclease QatD [Alicyclobacillus dauci]WAH37049.1 TatD family hydrolase [Alicyclobacillus dauci]